MPPDDTLFWLDDPHREVIEPFLPTKRGDRCDDRRALSGMMHVSLTGCRWHECPRDYGYFFAEACLEPIGEYPLFVVEGAGGVAGILREQVVRIRDDFGAALDEATLSTERVSKAYPRRGRPVQDSWAIGYTVADGTESRHVELQNRHVQPIPRFEVQPSEIPDDAGELPCRSAGREVGSDAVMRFDRPPGQCKANVDLLRL